MFVQLEVIIKLFFNNWVREDVGPTFSEPARRLTYLNINNQPHIKSFVDPFLTSLPKFTWNRSYSRQCSREPAQGPCRLDDEAVHSSWTPKRAKGDMPLLYAGLEWRAECDWDEEFGPWTGAFGGFSRADSVASPWLGPRARSWLFN